MSVDRHYYLLLLPACLFFPLASFGQVPTLEPNTNLSVEGPFSSKADNATGILTSPPVRLASQEITTLRTPLSISLGNVEPGATREFEIPLVNRLGIELHPTDAERSCGCISGSLQSNSMQVGEPFLLRVRIRFPDRGGQHFRQQLKLLDKDPVVAPLVLNFSASVREVLSLEPPLIRVLSKDSPVESTVMLSSTMDSWELDKAVVTSTMSGVKVDVRERHAQRLKLIITVDPSKAFHGRLAEAVPIVVQNIYRSGIAKECMLTCPITFDRFLCCTPRKIVFIPQAQKLVGRLILNGNFSTEDSEVTPESKSNRMPLSITTSWENSKIELNSEVVLLRPNTASLVLTIDDARDLLNERIRIHVNSMDVEDLLVPIDTFSKSVDTTLILNRKD